MTGRDFALVVLVAAVAGAGAAFGAGLVSQPAPPPDTSAELASRLDRIETALARAADGQKEAKESAARLSERVTGLQMDVNTAREEIKAAAAAAPVTAFTEAPSADPAAAIANAMRHARGKRVRLGDLGSGGTFELKADDVNVIGADSASLGGLGTELSRRLEGLGAGLSLRMLPEAKRWEKAKTDLGLQDYQVENLKKAVADRDAAIQDAMKVETSTDGDHSTIKVRRMDREKARTAQGDYDRKVTEALDSDQRKKWDEKGYGHAFGSPSGGASIAVMHSVEMDVDSGDEKSDGK